MTLFDLPTDDEANRRRDTGLNAAVRHSGQTWIEYATRYIRRYLERNEILFCDDVWASGLTTPESPRAFGQVMKNAIRNGWMTASGPGRPSKRGNNSIRPVYRSAIYNPTTTDTYPTWTQQETP